MVCQPMQDSASLNCCNVRRVLVLKASWGHKVVLGNLVGKLAIRPFLLAITMYQACPFFDVLSFHRRPGVFQACGR
jgi:hypothetical protein